MKTTAKISTYTGLTPQQEETAFLLASGKTPTEVAKLQGISRNTLYTWKRKDVFIVYLNGCRNEVKHAVRGSLYNLAKDAVGALKECLHSDNETIKLSSAKYIIDKIGGDEEAQGDIIEKLRSEATYSEEWTEKPIFHEAEFQARLDAHGLKDPLSKIE